MNLKQEPEDKQRADRLLPIFTDWMNQLGLTGEWLVTYYFVSDLMETHTSARVITNDPYRKAAIQIDRRWVDAATDNDLEESVVHELLHLAVDNISSVVRYNFGEAGSCAMAQVLHDAVETTCDKLTATFLSVRYEGYTVRYDPNPYVTLGDSDE